MVTDFISGGMHTLMKTCIPLLLTIVACASVAVAQSTKDKIEIAVQTTSLTLVNPDVPSFDSTQAGIGGRFTFNFNRSIAAEAELNFLPQKENFLTDVGPIIQGQFGVKAGKRFEKFGIFGKGRPGFLSIDKYRFTPPQGSQGGATFFPVERRALFTIDVGGVLELYPSKRMVVRFEAGDTVIRHPALFAQISATDPTRVQIREKKINHNFQFTAGVGFRLGDFPDETASSSDQERTRRFEVGMQFTSLFVNPQLPAGIIDVSFEHTEPGFGGRFTFNLTENIAFEAEGNYFTRLLRFSTPQGGHIFQGQFGGKVGKRFERWGFFGKARPGFVGFTQAIQFSSQSFFPFTVKKRYPSLDLGGVLEFYISPRWMARFDVGDTIIRYPEISLSSVGQLPVFVLEPKATHHNLQVSSGIGLRF
jgi:hypothetical protein